MTERYPLLNLQIFNQVSEHSLEDKNEIYFLNRKTRFERYLSICYTGDDRTDEWFIKKSKELAVEWSSLFPILKMKGFYLKDKQAIICFGYNSALPKGEMMKVKGAIRNHFFKEDMEVFGWEEQHLSV